MFKHVGLYWWRDKSGTPNFGDELTRPILENLYDCSVSHTAIASADMLSTGSVLQKVLAEKSLYKRERLLRVVGSGLISPKIKPKAIASRFFANNKFPRCISIESVRGYFTQQIVSHCGVEVTSVGDPAFLLPKVYHPDASEYYKVGIIPHFSKLEDSFWIEFAEARKGVVIDFRDDNLERVVDAIVSCEMVVSQSLHGLILADAYNIPSAWLYDGDLHSGGVYKFYDYFTSVGRPLKSFLTRKDLSSEANISNACSVLQPGVVQDLQANVDGAFRRALTD